MAKKFDNPCNSKCCDEVREGLSAMIDGEAGDKEVVELRRHLRECRHCEAHFEALSILHIRLREELVDSADTEAVWEKVSEGLDIEDLRLHKQKTQSRRQAFTRRWAPMAAAAMLLVAVFMGTSNIWKPDVGMLPVVTETNRDYETYRVSGRPLDVSAARPAEVKQWMAAKLDFALPANMSGPAGFKLAGGRLCSFLNRRLAFFQYERGDVGLSLYVMKGAGLKLPRGDGLTTISAQQGFTTVVWRQDDLVYLLVSELPEQEVEALAERMLEGVRGGVTHSEDNRRDREAFRPSRA